MKHGEVLKTDILGRVKTPRERREMLLDEFERSGLAGTKFAELVGVNYQTFATWAQRRRRERKEYPTQKRRAKARSPKVRWIEAVMEKEAEGSSQKALNILLPGGARLEISDERQASLAAVVLRSLQSKAQVAC